MLPQAIRDERAPEDAYGPGYVTYNIRTNFRDLCRMVGKEAARQQIAEIINDEFEGRRPQ